jgi:hypothetical protein
MVARYSIFEAQSFHLFEEETRDRYRTHVFEIYNRILDTVISSPFPETMSSDSVSSVLSPIGKDIDKNIVSDTPASIGEEAAEKTAFLSTFSLEEERRREFCGRSIIDSWFSLG